MKRIVVFAILAMPERTRSFPYVILPGIPRVEGDEKSDRADEQQDGRFEINSHRMASPLAHARALE